MNKKLQRMVWDMVLTLESLGRDRMARIDALGVAAKYRRKATRLGVRFREKESDQ